MIKEMQQLLKEAEQLFDDGANEEVLDLCDRAFIIYKDTRNKQYQSVKGRTCRELLLQIATYVYTICERGDVRDDTIVPRTELALFTEVAVALNMSTQELQNYLIANENEGIEL